MFQMEEGKVMNASAAGVCELLGALVDSINEVPEIIPSGSSVVPSDNPSMVETDGNLDFDFGKWFLGRDIQILYMGSYFTGKVINYAKDFGRYIVRYEDDETEEFYWKELLEIICALDVTILHKTLTSMPRVIQNKKKFIHRSKKNGACLKNLKIKTKKTKRNKINYCGNCNNRIIF